MYKCDICNKNFNTKQALGGHKSSHSRGVSYIKKRQTENSKIRTENSKREKVCKYCNKKFDKYQALGGHIIMCVENPNSQKIKNKISKSRKGRVCAESTRKKLSESMKIAHKEGRAWNIGKSRWNNKQSYPEKFFSNVIENHFDDKNYIIEYPLGIYSIDFAWEHKKLGIEIDGEQHYRFDDYKKRDLKKDKLAKKLGWTILRIRWKDMYNNPHQYIETAKNFIKN